MFHGECEMLGWLYHHVRTPKVHIAMLIVHIITNAIPSFMMNQIHNYESKVDFLNKQTAGANLLQPYIRRMVTCYQPRRCRVPGQPARSYQNISPSERRAYRHFRLRSDH